MPTLPARATEPRTYSAPRAPGPQVVRKAEAQHKHRAALEARKRLAARGEVPFFQVRPARIADVGLITDAWLTSYRTSPAVQGVPAKVYRIEQRDRIRRVMSVSKVLCAVDHEDENRIAGWVVFAPAAQPGRHVVLHYLSVHPTLQNLGLGAALMRLVRSLAPDPDAPVFCTHYTVAIRGLLKRWNLLYNPYLLGMSPEDYP